MYILHIINAIIVKQCILHFVKHRRQITGFVDFNAVLHFIEKCHYAIWIRGEITHLHMTAED